MPQSLTPLAPATTAQNTADITVAATTTIFAYTADGLFPGGFQARLLRKVGTNYQPVYDDRGSPVILSESRLEVTVYAPGVYRVAKSATPYAIGFGTDVA